MKDQELLKLLKEDFAVGYSELMDTYIGLVYVIARSKLNTICSEEVIEEFVSDVFYLFLNQIEDIDLNKGTIKAYLSVIAKRKAIRTYYEQTRKPSTYSLDDDAITIELVSKKNTERRILEKEKKREIIGAIQDLGHPDSEIIIRKYYYGQTASEIGEQINMSPKSVAKRSERALVKLRRKLENVKLGGLLYE
ncbi:MAG: sigma-70 family RNA polymerase sigma factor [bacterium]|nr:sigma-70 family RNA polymerase sigma factor [bacterium]